MTIFTTYDAIDKTEWGVLIAGSQTATWFQTQSAYDFYTAQPELFSPFVVAVVENGLKGVCVGYVTREKSAIKQFFTRRAIIIGGPALADNASNEQVTALMFAVRNLLENKAIYIETRNFNDYTKWKQTFANAGFAYEKHLNFHVDTSSLEYIDTNLSKNRKRDIRTSFRDGVTIIDSPSWEQVCHFYNILKHLYKYKIKTPFFPLSFFKNLFQHPDGRFILVEYQGQIVGGTVCVILQNRCLYEWFVAGQDGQYKSIFPSSIATYAGLKYAAEHNCFRFDMMGAGNPGEAYGVRDFKARFGGEKVEHGRFKFISSQALYKIGELGVKMLKHI